MSGYKLSFLFGLITAGLFLTTSLFSQPVFNNVSLPSRATIPQRLYFSGIVTDVVGLRQISMKVSGPANKQVTVFTEQLSGFSKDLGVYYFDSGHPNYSNVQGSYTITLTFSNQDNRVISQ